MDRVMGPSVGPPRVLVLAVAQLLGKGGQAIVVARLPTRSDRERSVTR